VNNEGLSEIIGAFPVPLPREKRERNDDLGQKRRGTGSEYVRPITRFPPIFAIGSQPIILTTLIASVSTTLFRFGKYTQGLIMSLSTMSFVWFHPEKFANCVWPDRRSGGRSRAKARKELSLLW
jgi:hypothetical protein